MTLLIIDKDFLYQFNLGLIAPLFTGSFREMFEKNFFFKFSKVGGSAHEKTFGHRDWSQWAHCDQNGHSQPWPGPWLSCDLAVIILKMLWLSCDLAVNELWPLLAVTEPWSLGPDPWPPWAHRDNFFSWVWLVGKVDNHVAIYGSKVADVFSAFQRRSCCLNDIYTYLKKYFLFFYIVLRLCWQWWWWWVFRYMYDTPLRRDKGTILINIPQEPFLEMQLQLWDNVNFYAGIRKTSFVSVKESLGLENTTPTDRPDPPPLLKNKLK